MFCIVLTETWLEDNVPNSYFCPTNYIAFRKDRNCNGGGVAILIKSELVATEFNFLFVKRGLKTDLLSVHIGRTVPLTMNF